MPDSSHPLESWIVSNTSQARFAKTAGLSEPYLSEILSGKKRPSLKMASRLSRATGGDVPIEAFVGLSEAEAAQ
jgi:transcriptional regulator with XRE-family HTH domain